MFKLNYARREVLFHGTIGAEEHGFFGTDSIEDALEELGAGPVRIRLDSPGGSVDDAIAIVELLNTHKGAVSIFIDGSAMSAATILTSSFPTVAGANSQLMLHGCWCTSSGDARGHRKIADTLDSYDERLLALYLRKVAGKTSRETLRQWLEKETYLSAPKAREAGLIDAIGTADTPAPVAPTSARRATPTPATERFPKLARARQRALELRIAQLSRSSGRR
jgi:ATP-dependent Clp protease protease subunit